MVEGIELAESLQERRIRLFIWGGGYVGLSSAIAFAARGVPVLIYDPSADRVQSIEKGCLQMPGFEKWIGMEVAPLVLAGLLRAALLPSFVPKNAVHLVAVPTESDGEPNLSTVRQVLSQIAPSSPALAIIESTLPPGAGRRLGAEFPEIPFVAAPRRDWFLEEGRDLRSLPRVYAGDRPFAAAAARAILSIVSDQLQEASTIAVVELTKCFENSVHHLIAMYASQLSRAFPNLNVNEAYRLATGHWRVDNEYFASVGTGGPCLPMATRYLLVSEDRESGLGLATEAIGFDDDQRRFVADLIYETVSSPIGLVGLTYRGNVPLLRYSPFVEIGRDLASRGCPILLHDPFCAEDAEHAIPGAKSLPLDRLIAQCEFILVGASHDEYRSELCESLLTGLRPGSCILDNEGTWSSFSTAFEEAGIWYRRVGDPGWTSPPRKGV